MMANSMVTMKVLTTAGYLATMLLMMTVPRLTMKMVSYLIGEATLGYGRIIKSFKNKKLLISSLFSVFNKHVSNVDANL